MSGKLVLYTSSRMCGGVYANKEPTNNEPDPVLDISKGVGIYGGLEFKKRAHGGIKVVDEKGHYMDISRETRNCKPYIDPEFMAACCLMTTGVGSDDFENFLNRRGYGVRGYDVKMFIKKRWTDIFQPERDLYDFEKNAINSECAQMVNFSDKYLFHFELFDETNIPKKTIFIEPIGNIRTPSTEQLHNFLKVFKKFLFIENDGDGKHKGKKAINNALFELDVNPPDGSVNDIDWAALLNREDSSQKVFVVQGNLTPLGKAFYNYCASEEPEKFNENFEIEYMNYGLLGEDGNLSNNGANILSILHAKQSIA